MSSGVKAILGLCAILIPGFLALFVLASLEMSLGAGLADVASTLWGVTTLADLGAGLLFVAAWIAILERSALRAAPWVVGMFLLGNFTLLIYILVRRRRARTVTELFLAPASDLPRPV